MSIDINVQVRSILQDGEPIGADTQCVTLKPDQFRRFMSRPELIGVLSYEDMARVASLCVINAAVSSVIVFFHTNEASVFEDVKAWRELEDFGPRLDSLTRPVPAHSAPERGARSGLDITNNQVRETYWDRHYGVEPEKRAPRIIPRGFGARGLTIIQGGVPHA